MANGSLTQGILHLPGATHRTKTLVESLLETDRETHHCFYGRVGFHNHLPHHLLAAYDLAASEEVLSAIYKAEAEVQSPINLIDRKEQVTGPPEATITEKNWTEYVGQEKYYVSYLTFFKKEVERLGSSKCIEEYIFSPQANGNETSMLIRFVSGAVHPLIQVGHGVEFNEPYLVASGIAQTAVTRASAISIFSGLSHAEPDGVRLNGHGTTEEKGRQPSNGLSLLEILRLMYDSSILKPIMPYQPDALLSTRMRDALTDGRPEEIARIASLWAVPSSPSSEEIDARIEEILWVATLLMAGTSKPNRKPRLDFFLMHILTGSLFLPSLTAALPTPANKATLLRAFIPVILLIVLLRGRPRIDPVLLMTYDANPAPPNLVVPKSDKAALGDPRESGATNPWTAILGAVTYAPDAHTVKAIRSLAYAAQKYGTTAPGGAIGAFDRSGKETHVGTAQMDGTIFIRAAGVVMDSLGWVSHGQREGQWDRSALGWDGAWEGEDKD